MDDTTTIRIFEKLEEIAIDVGVIKSIMIDKKTMAAAIESCRENPPPSKGGGLPLRMTAVMLGAMAALTATVITLTQML